MNDSDRKVALRMIPYAMYVLTTEGPEGAVSAASICWVMQTSFRPPMLAVAIKCDSGSHAFVEHSGRFVLNMLGKDQGELAVNFFKSHERHDDEIGGEPLAWTENGVPRLATPPAWVECKVTGTVEGGDHTVFVAEVTEAGVSTLPAGRPDDASLWIKDLGERMFYGG